MRKWALLAVCAAGLVGCSDKLETGYQPRKLGATGVERRGFYADAFTPEAREAASSRGDELQTRRERSR